MRLFTKSFIGTLCLIFLIWIMISWADVLLHQFAGSAGWWNLFRILVEVAG